MTQSHAIQKPNECYIVFVCNYYVILYVIIWKIQKDFGSQSKLEERVREKNSEWIAASWVYSFRPMWVSLLWIMDSWELWFCGREAYSTTICMWKKLHRQVIRNFGLNCHNDADSIQLYCSLPFNSKESVDNFEYHPS